MKTLSKQSGVRLGLALGLIAVLAGCTTAGAAKPASERGLLYRGWVRFAGEFALYADPSAFADSQTGKCVSGALPPEKQQEAAANFDGKRVIVRARAVPWSLPDAEALTMSNQGSPITNWCGGKEVLLASEMTLDERS
jgi:hypothetical protein